MNSLLLSLVHTGEYKSPKTTTIVAGNGDYVDEALRCLYSERVLSNVWNKLHENVNFSSFKEFKHSVESTDLIFQCFLTR